MELRPAYDRRPVHLVTDDSKRRQSLVPSQEAFGSSIENGDYERVLAGRQVDGPDLRNDPLAPRRQDIGRIGPRFRKGDHVVQRLIFENDVQVRLRDMRGEFNVAA